MPFKSKAQQRAMEAKAGRGEISQETIHEFERATDFKHLPEKAPTTNAHHAHGKTHETVHHDRMKHLEKHAHSHHKHQR